MSQKIEITNNWNIQKVFNELENGNMKIPRFQRGYVWERSKIVKLLNKNSCADYVYKAHFAEYYKHNKQIAQVHLL